MLVLTRATGERLMIFIPGRENPVTITLVRCNRDRARIGFEADSDIVAYREEIIPQKQDPEGQ